MSLNLILDASIPTLDEPGFWRFVSTRLLSEQGNPSNDGSHQGLWSDEPTRTLMLRPLQLESSWLNTANQGDSILRLYQPGDGSGDIVVNSADITAQAIFEAPAFGNADNPYIFHVPVGPSGAFPGHPAAVPGSAPSVVGYASPVVVEPDVVSIPSSLAQGPSLVFAPSVTMPPASAPPAPVQIGSTTDGKFIGGSKARLAANQPLFFRWFHPQSQLGFACIYEFYVGQYKLRVKDVIVEVFRDTSVHGDRSSWKKEQVCPLFSAGSLSPSGTGSVTAFVAPQEVLSHDRSLLWLPYRHNQVLLYSSAGKWAVLTVNGSPQRLADGSDWDIVRSDTLLVWVMTPAAGRFQVQRVKYPAGTIKVQSPTITLDYTPSIAPTITLTSDQDHGTTLSAAQSQPPAYTLPVNSANDCPPATTTTGDQRRTYGIELSFAASGDKRWTPFFYGYQIASARTFLTPATTPVTVVDTNTGSPLPSVLQHATITLGLEPGEGRMTAEVMDESPYSLSPFYYRCSLPVQLKDTGSGLNWFTGVTAPLEVTPLVETGAPRRLTFTAYDRWRQLADTYLRDQRDWTGYGHIDVLNFYVQQAGIDTTSATYPAGYTPASPPTLANLSTLNSPLGGSAPTLHQQTKDVKQGWCPRDDHTAATYVKQIADLYSGWRVGFRPDGTLFYLPRDFYTTPIVTFASQHSGVSPFFLNPVTFTTVEPEANVILVRCGNATTGAVTYSSLWIDWASIKNPNAPNYLGRWRAEVITIGGTFSCAQLNWVARTIWNQTRRRRRHVCFEAEFAPSLQIGQVFTLGGYGNYRLIGAHVKLDFAGYHRAQYTGEFIEDGF